MNTKNTKSTKHAPPVTFPIAPLTEADVTFTVECEPDDIDPADMFASGDDEMDRADVAAINERLDRGDVTAWCNLRVTATAPDDEVVVDGLGGCSLGPDESVETFARDHDLFSQALYELNIKRRARQHARTVRMCTTRYSGPTNTRGARVYVKHITTGTRASVAWDHALDSHDNHANAAARVLGRLPEFSTSVDGGGYIMGVDPANDPAE